LIAQCRNSGVCSFASNRLKIDLTPLCVLTRIRYLLYVAAYGDVLLLLHGQPRTALDLRRRLVVGFFRLVLAAFALAALRFASRQAISVAIGFAMPHVGLMCGVVVELISWSLTFSYDLSRRSARGSSLFFTRCSPLLALLRPSTHLRDFDCVAG